MVDQKAVEQLRQSLSQIGQLYPIITCAEDGEVLVGNHRKAAGAKNSYPIKVTAFAGKFGVSLEVAKLIIKAHGNVQRRVDMEETRGLVVAIAHRLGAGVPKMKVASRIAELLPYSHQYIDELLPVEFKMRTRPPGEIQLDESFPAPSETKLSKSFKQSRDQSEFRKRHTEEQEVLDAELTRRHIQFDADITPIERQDKFLCPKGHKWDSSEAGHDCPRCGSPGEHRTYYPDYILRDGEAVLVAEVYGPGTSSDDEERDDYIRKVVGWPVDYFPNQLVKHFPTFVGEYLQMHLQLLRLQK